MSKEKKSPITHATTINNQTVNVSLETRIPDLPPVDLDAFTGPLDILLQLIRASLLRWDGLQA